MTTPPKLTNRGPAGLYRKLKERDKERLIPASDLPSAQPPTHISVPSVNRDVVFPSLIEEVTTVSIDTISADPNNARLHPERNLEAIRQSLSQYGQVKPIIVRKSNNTIVAGNGTWEAAKSLGWTRIAVSFVDMDDVEATGFGLADNRTAELAKWDFETVARLDRLLQQSGHPSIGWTQDELEVLRAADWVPPPIEDEDEELDNTRTSNDSIQFEFGDYIVVQEAIETLIAQKSNGQEITPGRAVSMICKQWMENR